MQPYSINHNVVRGDGAISDCQTCHTDDSRLIAADRNWPATCRAASCPSSSQNVNVTASGEIAYRGRRRSPTSPTPRQDGVYVFGHNRVAWVDWLGALVFVGTLLVVAAHATLRFITAMRRPKQDRRRPKRVYMYDAYERFWHWLQTVTIILLLLTGLVIHRPDLFGMFSFPPHGDAAQRAGGHPGGQRRAVAVLAPGQRRDPPVHPAARTASSTRPSCRPSSTCTGSSRARRIPSRRRYRKKLNPLQQITYFGLLNVLLPLQIITGALMWGVQQWPQIADLLGGLPFLAPLHTLVAWLFATFIVAHVYLTTTGATVGQDINAMVTGWENVPVHEGAAFSPVPQWLRPLLKLQTGSSDP